MIPPEDIPSRGNVAAAVKEEGPLTEDQRQLLVELFDNLEVVHESAAQSCGILARLLRTLSTTQLKLVLWASVRPLVQFNALWGPLQ